MIQYKVTNIDRQSEVPLPKTLEAVRVRDLIQRLKWQQVRVNEFCERM